GDQTGSKADSFFADTLRRPSPSTPITAITVACPSVVLGSPPPPTNAMRMPSGDHATWRAKKFAVVSRRRWEPSASTTKRLFATPGTSAKKAILLPSGDHVEDDATTLGFV